MNSKLVILTPTIKEIRSGIEQLRYRELKRHSAWLASLRQADCARIESLTYGIANKLLHRVVCGLRESQLGARDSTYAAEVARNLLSAELNEKRTQP